MREEMYDTLLAWIMNGELRPGEKLLDKELAENMGVSRTPVREALRRLEDKGLVESAANRWTRVAEISIKEPEMIYPIIWSLEQLVVPAAIGKMTSDDFSAMQKANAVLKRALERTDPIEASIADIRFHEVFIKRAENPHITEILTDLKIKCRRVEVTYFEGSACSKYSLDEHHRIIAALEAGNTNRAQAAIQANWQNSLKRLKNVGCRAGLYGSDEMTHKAG